MKTAIIILATNLFNFYKKKVTHEMSSLISNLM